MQKANILFVCVGNSCRSQIAEGFGRAWGGAVLNVRSAGTHPIDSISPEIREVIAEAGIDISGQRPKALTEEMLRWADRVIILGGNPELIYPDLLRGKFIDWPTPDPYGQPVEEARKVRDLIKSRVTDLIINLGMENRE